MIGKKLAQLREEVGITQYRLADLAGVAPSTIKRIEEDTQIPSAKTLLALANALECGIDELLKPANTITPTP